MLIKTRSDRCVNGLDRSYNRLVYLGKGSEGGAYRSVAHYRRCPPVLAIDPAARHYHHYTDL